MANLDSQTRRLVREEVRSLLSQMLVLIESSDSPGLFLPPREAIARMGAAVKPAQLAAHVRSGFFRSGKEFIDVGTGGTRPTYRYDPIACRDRLAIPAERRKLKVV